MNLILADVIPGASVYGVPQMSYTVAGESEKDYAAALTVAAFRQATAIEAAASSYVAVVRQRQAKVSELGDVLATLAVAIGSMRTKDAEPGDHSATSWQMDRAFESAKAVCDKYGLSLNVRQKEVDKVLRNYMTRADVMRSQDSIQYALDVEDNNLQQDMVSMQGLVTKRDHAFSTASRIIAKVHNAADSAIGNM
ncbi:MAG: hypothetical protein IJK04_00895 [Kiritimatiellae bacterium]|nr:hypothetical protein [Kiritimatiellia bacterium]